MEKVERENEREINPKLDRRLVPEVRARLKELGWDVEETFEWEQRREGGEVIKGKDVLVRNASKQEERMYGYWVHPDGKYECKLFSVIYEYERVIRVGKVIEKDDPDPIDGLAYQLVREGL